MKETKELLGRSFAIADGRYRIVDVRRLGGDALIYAEPLDGPARPAAAPARAAFHYQDIAGLLDGAEAV